MRQIPYYQVDAFTRQPLAGNQAAVVLFEAWPADAKLAAIAAETNLANTAFLAPAGAGSGADYALRWFTPNSEVDLCGHATLAAGHIVLSHLQHGRDEVVFTTRWAGELVVAREGTGYAMRLPARPPQPVGARDGLAEALGGREPQAVLAHRDLIAVFDSAASVRQLTPDLARVAAITDFGVLVTAPGDATSGTDFVSRFFAPQKGIPEDPVTGSAHAELMPYWAQQWGRSRLTAAQLSPRSGEMTCRLEDEHVVLVAGVADFVAGSLASTVL